MVLQWRNGRTIAQTTMEAQMKLKFKKETKHTVVYEADTDKPVVPIESVYIQKSWLSQLTPRAGVDGWPQVLKLEITLEA